MSAALLARQTALRAHVEAVQASPCVWGRDDCTRWTADWVEAVRGVDLGLPAYAGEAQGRALIAAAGGLVALWSERLAAAGIWDAGLPAYGDVGLVETRLGPIGVIVAHDGICALRAGNGVTFLRPRRFLKLWSI